MTLTIRGPAPTPTAPAEIRGVAVFPGEGELPDPLPDGILDGDLWLNLTTGTFTLLAPVVSPVLASVAGPISPLNIDADNGAYCFAAVGQYQDSPVVATAATATLDDDALTEIAVSTAGVSGTFRIAAFSGPVTSDGTHSFAWAGSNTFGINYAFAFTIPAAPTGIDYQVANGTSATYTRTATVAPGDLIVTVTTVYGTAGAAVITADNAAEFTSISTVVGYGSGSASSDISYHQATITGDIAVTSTRPDGDSRHAVLLAVLHGVTP